MSIFKRKRGVLEGETVFQQTEKTPFQSAFLVLDDVDGVDDVGAPPPLTTKRRRLDTDTHVQNRDGTQLVVKNETSGQSTVSCNTAAPECATGTNNRRVDISTSEDTPKSETTMLAVPDDKTSINDESRRDPMKLQAMNISTTASAESAKVIIRLQLLVAQHAPLDMRDLSRLYQDSFGECLDFKSLGFANLKSFVESVPLVNMRRSGSYWILSLSLTSSAALQSQPKAPKQADTTVETDIVGSQESSTNEEPHFFEERDISEDNRNETDKRGVENNPRDLEASLQAANEPPRNASEEECLVKDHVKALVFRHAPLELSFLPKLYKDVIGESLDVQSFGFRNLKSFVATIPLVDMQETEGDWILVWSSMNESQELVTSASAREANGDASVASAGTFDDASEEDQPLLVTTDASDDDDACRESDKKGDECSLDVTNTLQVMNEPPSDENLEWKVKKRVKALVACNAHIDICRLPKLYEDTFIGDRLDYKSLGFRKLKDLVQSIDEIQMEQSGSNWFLSSSSQENTASELVVSGKDQEATTKATFDALKETAILNSQGNILYSTVTQAIDIQRSDGNTEQEVKRRVQAHVVCHAPMKLCHLPRRYQKMHGEPINHKFSGYRKLKGFVQSIDTVETRLVDTEWMLFSSAQEQKVGQMETTTSNEVKLIDAHAVEGPLQISEDSNVDGDARSDTETIKDEFSNRTVRQTISSTKKSTNNLSEASTTQKRVQLLVARHAPLGMSDVSQLYQDSFGEFLDYKSLGFGNLKSFVDSLPLVEATKFRSNWILSSSSSVDELSREQSVSIVESSKVFGCLGCGQQHTVWGRLLAHMLECCPEKTITHKLQQKCRIGHKKCAVPNQEKMTKSNPSVEDMGKLYGCLSCGDLQGQWGPCLQHMKECSPELIVDCASNAFQRRCTIGDGMCNVPGHEQGTDLRYGCPDCGNLVGSWSQCLEHMQECCAILLDNKEGLLWKCRLGGEQCEVPGYDKAASTKSHYNEATKGAADTNEAPCGEENQDNQRSYSHVMESDKAKDSPPGRDAPAVDNETATLSPYDREVARLKHLIAKYQPLVSTKIPELYKNEFQERLYVRGLGFSSLDEFVDLVSFIKVSFARNKHDRVLSIRNEALSSLDKKRLIEGSNQDAPPPKKQATIAGMSKLRGQVD